MTGPSKYEALANLELADEERFAGEVESDAPSEPDWESIMADRSTSRDEDYYLDRAQDSYDRMIYGD